MSRFADIDDSITLELMLFGITAPRLTWIVRVASTLTTLAILVLPTLLVSLVLLSFARYYAGLAPYACFARFNLQKVLSKM